MSTPEVHRMSRRHLEAAYQDALNARNLALRREDELRRHVTAICNEVRQDPAVNWFAWRIRAALNRPMT